MTDWERLTPARSAEVREVWGLTGTEGGASGAACPEHGEMWACGCGGCEAALTARYGVYGAEASGGAR